MNVVTHGPSETREVAGALATLLEPGDVVLLSGDLGAGKTEFAKGVAAGLGVTDTVVSPTFTLAREYDGRLRMLHVDLYRVASTHEVLDLGLDDLAGSEDGRSDAVLLVEWGDIAASVLPTDHLLVHLAPVADGEDDDRSLTFSTRGPVWTARAASLDAAVPAHLVHP
jgi:tRNA threonylcarbamoyladenosine biosynthesis protein TsaE